MAPTRSRAAVGLSSASIRRARCWLWSARGNRRSAQRRPSRRSAHPCSPPDGETREGTPATIDSARRSANKIGEEAQARLILAFRRARKMRKTFNILLDAYWRFLGQDGWAIASHIALSTLTSLFPFLIFVTALAGLVGAQDLAEEATKIIFAVWPPVVARPIASEVQNVLTAPRSGLLTLGAGLALYFASGAIEAARVGLNRAYGATETRPWWLLRLESIAFVVIAAIGLLALAFLVVLGPLIWATTLSYLPQLEPLHSIVTFTRIGVATALMAISLFLAHLLLPKGRRRLIDLAPGVAL